MTWTVIPSCPQHEASDNGRIRHRISGRDLRQTPTWNGYLTVSIKGTKIVSRLVCEAFHGPPPSPNHHAAHRDGDRTNNNDWNLRWLTWHENYADQLLHGTDKKGSKHPNAKLAENDVRQIRLLSSVYSQPELARIFQVSQCRISLIVNYKVWTHI